jgi:hypothetical protein
MYFASAVLGDGTVFVAGGEYNSGIADSNVLATQVYDPVGNSWKTIHPPSGWTVIGGAPCCILADGRLLLGSLLTGATAIFDPETLSFNPGPNKDGISRNENWTLLPDGSVLTVECSSATKAEKYNPFLNKWIGAGSTPPSLAESESMETGPAILLPNGRVFAIGATCRTAIYQPQTQSTQSGTWKAGPDFPIQNQQQLIARDTPACLLPNGRVLCTAGPQVVCAADQGGHSPPTAFFAFDPVTSTLNAVPRPPKAANAPHEGRMLLLPTGQVLYANGTTDIEIFTPDGVPNAAWAPTITRCPKELIPGETYSLEGQQLNGLSQAVSSGNRSSTATNYPLVRFRNEATGKVWYFRTANHSTMGVATGASLQTTRFTVPVAIETGPGELVVVANGIASSPRRAMVTFFS